MSRILLDSPTLESPTFSKEPISTQEASTLIKIIAIVKNMLDIVNDTSRQTQGNINDMKEKLKKLTEDQASDKYWLGIIAVASGALSVIATIACGFFKIPTEIGSAATNALSKAVSMTFELNDFRNGANRELELRLFDQKTNDKNNTSGLTREYKDSGKEVGNLYTNAAHGG